MSETDLWLERAADDLRTAEVLLAAGIFNQVCFHAQQCVEKLLKAALIAQGVVYPRSHNLPVLLNMLDQSKYADLFALSDRVRLLDRFYMATRYPDIAPGATPGGMPGREDAVEALDLAREISTVVRSAL